MAKRKRVVIAATVTKPNHHCETFTHCEFFTFKPEHVEEAIRAVRSRFAKKHDCEQDNVTITQALEKVRYHTPNNSRAAIPNDEYNERNAVAYATWLAQRDGLIIPAEYNAKPRCDWSSIDSIVRTRTVKQWNGTVSTYAASRKRVRAVEWGTESKEEVYNTRKDGRRGAYSHTAHHFELLLRVEIPHWDFEHPEPVEELTEETRFSA